MVLQGDTEIGSIGAVSRVRATLRLSLLALGVAGCLAASWSFKQQELARGCWLWVGGLIVVVFAAGTAVRQRGAAREVRVSAGEVAVVALLLAFGAGVRFWEVTELPGGVWSDEAEIGLDAIEILNGTNTNLLTVGRIEVPRLYAGMLALLFKYAGISVLTIKMPGLVFSVVGLLTTYLLSRYLLGPWPAVLALGLLAGARWPLNMSRWGHVQTWLIPAVTLVPWLTARFLRSGRYATAAFAGLVLALSQYTYHSCRLAVAVTGALTVVLCVHEPALIRTRWRQLLVMGCTALVIFGPLGWFYFQHPERYLGRAREVSLLHNLPAGQVAADALWASAKAYLLMFNVRGDSLGRHNFGMRPMVDWITGGLALAGIPLLFLWWRRWEVQFLWCFSVLALSTGIFTTGAPSTFRTLSQIVPYLMVAALPLVAAYQLLAPRPLTCRLLLGPAVGALVISTSMLNLSDYFGTHAVHRDHWIGFNTAVTEMAVEAATMSEDNDAYYPSVYRRNPEFALLIHGKANHYVYDTPIADGRGFPAVPLPFPYHGRGVVYFDDKRLAAKAVAALYPGAQIEEVFSPFGLYLYSRVVIDRTAVRDGHGLWLEAGGERRKVEDLEVAGEARAPSAGYTWSGSVRVPAVGRYRFSVVRPGGSGDWWMEVGGRRVTPGSGGDAACVLPSGLVSFRVHVEPDSNAGPISILWARDDRELDPVPREAWSRLEPDDTGLVVEDYDFVTEAREPIGVRRVLSWEPFPVGVRAEWRNVYSGKIVAPLSGSYRLRLDADDGAYMYVDGALLGQRRSGTSESDVRNWEAGTEHPMVLVYYQNGGSFHFDFLWHTPGSSSFVPVPVQALKLDWSYLARAPWSDPESRAEYLGYPR